MSTKKEVSIMSTHLLVFRVDISGESSDGEEEAYVRYIQKYVTCDGDLENCIEDTRSSMLARMRARLFSDPLIYNSALSVTISKVIPL